MKKLTKPLLAAFVLCLIVMVILYSTTGGKEQFDYGIAIDAGSSHSTVTLYNWSANKHTTGYVESISSCEVSKGIDDNLDNVNKTIEELMPCVNDIINQIPKGSSKPFPIFLGATAGMRILNIINHNISELIISSIKDELNKNDYLSVKEVKILTGDNEGLFAWISANFLMKFIPENKESEYPEINKNATIGILDMGGASAQIAYEIDKLLDNKITEVNLFGKKYNIFSQSNLCFGSDQAHLRFIVTLLSKSIKRNINFTNPCSTEDAPDFKFKGISMEENPCLKTRFLDGINRSQEYTIKGKMDPIQCSQYMKEIVQSNCKFNICPNYTKLPEKHSDFFAFSSYFYAVSLLIKDMPKVNTLTYEQFRDGSSQYCNLPFESKKKLSKYPEIMCAKMWFIYHILREYGFNDNTIENIHFVDKIQKHSLGWSLGYMLVQTNSIPAKPLTQPIISKLLFIILTNILILGIILSIVYYFINFRRSRKL